VIPVEIKIHDFEKSLDLDLISALEDAYQNSPYKIRALVLSNPHNPLGRCYTKSVLEDCVKFCHKRNIHFISDEVFALSTFECPQLPDGATFVSALSLDVASLGCNPALVHTVWSPSKDFGASGIKLVRLRPF
jgi:aspartate/methionine/tyrosine aminotransferase